MQRINLKMYLTYINVYHSDFREYRIVARKGCVGYYHYFVSLQNSQLLLQYIKYQNNKVTTFYETAHYRVFLLTGKGFLSDC